MKAISVRSPMKVERAKCDQRRAYEKVFHALIISFLALAVGCTTKTRSIELAGMYANESGTLAIGSVDVMAAPTGEESAFIKYDEDNAWLSPSMKLHDIKIMLTGTNSTAKAELLVKHICDAFVAVRPAKKNNEAEEGTDDK